MSINERTIFALSLFVIWISVFSFLVVHGPFSSDSYAFISFGCSIESGNPDTFVFGQLSTIWNYYPCDSIAIAAWQATISLILLLSFWKLMQHYTKQDLWLFPLIVLGSSPLFFTEAVRFENDIIGLTIMAIAVLLLETEVKNRRNLVRSSSLIMMVIAFFTWHASILLLVAPLIYRFDPKKYRIQWVVGLGLISLLFLPQITGVITNGVYASELIAGIGFLYLIPLYLTQKDNKAKKTSLFMSLFGIIQLKYMYISIPFWVAGTENWIKSKEEKIQKIIIAMLFVAIIAYPILLLGTFPTTEDKQLVQRSLCISSGTCENQQFEKAPLYFHWDYKWLMYLNGGKQEKDNPQWTEYEKPYYGIFRNDENYQNNCTLVDKTINNTLWNYELRYCE